MPSKNPSRQGSGAANAWDLKEIEKLIDLLSDRQIAEFELEKNGIKIRIQRGIATQAPVEAAAPPAPLDRVPANPAVVPSSPPPGSAAVSGREESGAASEAGEAAEGLHIIKSPIVGTFYSSPSPSAPPFVKVGDVVEVGQVLCIIEAMKLMNEIESEAAGQIGRIYVENGQPVEYGQSLFAIKPSMKK
ncbi:MAG TPA: acetyl-CoA carboxylase biotin carboxyl carrier protein [Terriglobia bacterium]|nr:acetyl-CoA carboxylase biotin carboxyl carrier protein [Terriglobia bacterium]